MNSAHAANIAGGQKLHLGRFLFACQITKFREQLQNLVREMEVGGVSGTTFHVARVWPAEPAVDALSMWRWR